MAGITQPPPERGNSIPAFSPTDLLTILLQPNLAKAPQDPCKRIVSLMGTGEGRQSRSLFTGTSNTASSSRCYKVTIS